MNPLHNLNFLAIVKHVIVLAHYFSLCGGMRGSVSFFCVVAKDEDECLLLLLLPFLVVTVFPFASLITFLRFLPKKCINYEEPKF